MKSHATLAHESVWAASVETPLLPPLDSNARADVCVIGAGIAGLTTAYHLARAGQKVIVLDDGPIGGGQTQMTSAHLASAIDDRFYEIERLHGREGAYLAAESHATAIDCIELLADEEHIACDFQRVDGYLFVPPDEPTDVLDREYDAVERTGVVRAVLEERVPWSHFDTGRCLRFERQAQFHPLKYLCGLARAIIDHGGQIHCRTHAGAIEGGRQAHVDTTRGPRVSARHIVVATNTPINDLVAIHTKQAPYITYVIAARIPHGAVRPALYWDTADPYHYVRVQAGGSQSDHDLLIVGGEDHKTGQAHDGEERFFRLEMWARERFPFIEGIAYQWAGQVMETIDGLAFIGRNPMDEENVYVATGDSGMGLTHGTIAGMLLADLILGRENPWARIYDPSRKPLGALAHFAKENLNVALQYGTWLTPGEASSVESILPGRGAVVRRGLSKVAVYRDDEGQLHECSAVCPHLKCIVSFNDTQRTWDCPCHGSRFDVKGKVLNGPANVDLPRE